MRYHLAYYSGSKEKGSYSGPPIRALNKYWRIEHRSDSNSNDEKVEVMEGCIKINQNKYTNGVKYGKKRYYAREWWASGGGNNNNNNNNW